MKTEEIVVGHDITVTELEKAIAYQFTDKQLLARAVTHRSWAHERAARGSEMQVKQLHNEALEFVGDSILGLIISDYLFRHYSEVSEGELSRMKHRLVSAPTLARAAARLNLGEYLRVGKGEEKTGGRSKRALLSDVFEAVLAAIYLDGGLEAARKFVLHAMENDLNTANPLEAAAADYKSKLQERLQVDGGVAPHYKLVETLGPPHNRIFRVEVRIGDVIVKGEGSTIKAAETIAAHAALQFLEAPENTESKSQRKSDRSARASNY